MLVFDQNCDRASYDQQHIDCLCYVKDGLLFLAEVGLLLIFLIRNLFLLLCFFQFLFLFLVLNECFAHCDHVQV